MMRRVKGNLTIVSFLMLGLWFLVSGCGVTLELAMVGAGKSATIESTNFFKSYEGLVPASEADKKAYSNLPDLYYMGLD